MPTPHIPPAASGDDPAYLDGLNPPQRQAVLATEGPLLVLAGAGTGKTRVLTTRLAHLVATKRAWPSEILAVTFTNKAAREMQDRTSALLGQSGQDQSAMPWLGTFHAICARMLRRHAEIVGLNSNFTILDTDDQLRLLKQIILAAGIDEKQWPARRLAGIIDGWKNKGWTPDLLAQHPDKGGFADGQGGMLYRTYQDRLRQLNACDFGDLILHMLTILQTHTDILSQWQQRFKYILVDEYQDSNIAQYLWMRLLAQKWKNICCVGDDDQSIYSWRGAEVANIIKFEKDFENASVIRLEQNYRSGTHILGAASALIAHNDARLGKTLWTDMGEGHPVHVLSVWDGAEEARHIGAQAIQAQRDGDPLSHMAILVRAQFQTRELEDHFIEIGLPYRIVGGMRFYERQEIRDALAYLRLVNFTGDDLAFERIFNTPRRGMGEKSMQKLRAYARDHGLSLFAAAQAMLTAGDGAKGGKFAQFIQDIARWRQHIGQGPHGDLARMILEESGYIAMWRADQSIEAKGRLENLEELRRAMDDFATLADFLDHVALMTENAQSDQVEKITIMTIHAAKGLEFKRVFLPGWEEGLFPNQRALDESGDKALQEERRLAYVALTRAREQAIILHAANRRIYGQWTSSIPSRFIAELPAQHIETQTTMTPQGHWDQGHGNRAGNSSAAAHISAARRARAIAPPSHAFSVGQRVAHAKFGEGYVMSIEADKISIAFDGQGLKHIMADYVRPAS